jgi:hypothetical protein
MIVRLLSKHLSLISTNFQVKVLRISIAVLLYSPLQRDENVLLELCEDSYPFRSFFLKVVILAR